MIGLLKRFALWCCVIALFHIPQAIAQDATRIAAVVNDEIITLHDVQTRIGYAMLSANLPNNPEVLRRIAPQVLRKVIDERLQLQEAARLDISISEQDILNGVRTIEQNNRMPAGGFRKYLETNNVSLEVAKAQLQAELAWIKIIRRTTAASIKIGETDIDTQLDILKAAQGKPEYLLAEIYLPIESAQQEEEAYKLGERLLEQLKAGASFPKLAQQFSQNASAAAGGDLGWVQESLIDRDLAQTVKVMESGQVSPVIRTNNGLYILALREKRIAGSGRLPTRDEIRQKLEGDRLELAARRYLRDLRRQAFIDIRM